MKLKNGDIFEFSISDDKKSYGQIISTFKKDTITIIIFEGQYNSRPNIEELLNDNILFLGNTLDAKLYHKHWIIIANETSNIESVKFPFYKIGTSPIYIKDFYENKIRKIRSIEDGLLNYRAYVAPVRFESALRAYYKIIEWDTCFDELLYSNILRSRELIEDGI